jgi:hypothetical protein
VGDFGGLAEALYSRFLLRDVFGKIVPGTLLLLSLVHPYFPMWSGLKEWPWPVWLFLIGLSWLLGFAVQAFGEKTHIIRHYPKVLEKIGWREIRAHDPQLMDLNGKRIPGEYQILHGEKNWADFCHDFNEVASKDFTLPERVERFIVIKEACGNGFVAMILGLSKVLVYLTIKSSVICYLSEIRQDLQMLKHIGLLALVGLVVVALFFMHRIHVSREFCYMITALWRLSPPDSEKPPE